MFYVAFAKNANPLDRDDLMARSQKWWNEGERPEGLKTTAVFRTVGGATPNVFIFETDSHDDLMKAVSFWRGLVEFDIHPALDALAEWRDQGMKVD